MPRNKKLLLITYYWPPCGGVAVQRWLKHVKYLGEFGWDVVVYTADGADYPSRDDALLQEVPDNVQVIRQPIWEPYGIYRKLTGRKEGEQMQSAFNVEDKKPSLMQRLAVWVRSNYFIPDARKFWVRPSVRFLKEWLAEHSVDAVVTNGTPHSCHLIGLALRQSFPNLPWLADFRDPWTGIDYFSTLPLGTRARAKHEKLERQVMQQADFITTVSWTWQKDFEQISGKANVGVVTNGYDAPQFA
ncbi:MAG: glycosyltransferase, partial [Bacteroidota bacterium]